ncbi:MAG: hypothetical protein E3K37_03270 [Candidatus Kuenenia sp.]|nr:hypothetical protein [Candidatus Kuenenia hertensis]
MSKNADFELGNDTNIVSLLILGAATLGGMAIGWFSKQFLGRKQIRQEVIETIKTMTRNEIDQIFSGAEKPNGTTGKQAKTKEIIPVQS